MSERQARDGGSDTERAQAEDLPLDGDEVGEASGGRSFGQAVAMAGADCDRTLHRTLVAPRLTSVAIVP